MYTESFLLYNNIQNQYIIISNNMHANYKLYQCENIFAMHIDEMFVI